MDDVDGHMHMRLVGVVVTGNHGLMLTEAERGQRAPRRLDHVRRRGVVAFVPRQDEVEGQIVGTLAGAPFGEGTPYRVAHFVGGEVESVRQQIEHRRHHHALGRAGMLQVVQDVIEESME